MRSVLDGLVAPVTQKTFAQLLLVCLFLSQADLATETQTIVSAQCLDYWCLDYCKLLGVGLPLKTLWKPQLVQNAAAQVLTDILFGLLLPLWW